MLWMKRLQEIGLIWFAVAVLAACTNYKEPAQAALTEAETAIQGIAADAEKYASTEYQALKDKLAAAKANFDSGKHKEALEAAKTLPAEVTNVSAVAAAKKQEVMDQLSAEWTTLSADVPQMVAAISSRVDVLSKSRKKPEGFEQARAGLDGVKSLWGEATAAASSGNFEDAIAKGRAVQTQGKEIMTLLGMNT